jgi:hypothetical protein
MTTAAHYAFSVLALSAKVHRLLDRVGEAHERRRKAEGLAFDDHIAAAVQKLLPDVQQRQVELAGLREELALLEHSFHELKAQQPLPKNIILRFEMLIAKLQQQIAVKELTSPSP